jgi:Holliday junction DNA helicase RuvA
MPREFLQDGSDYKPKTVKIRGCSLYAYIKGSLEYKHADHMVVEANGVGYRIQTSLSSIEACGPVGSEIKVYTHLYVREDNMSLFGFITQEELGMFELLITVSGVGPKAALSLISAVSPSRFGLTVISEDIKTLTKAQGIGNKMAQRIILELKDKIKKEQLAAASMDIFDGKVAGNETSRISEAINALMVLGYSSNEAGKAVAAVYSEDMELEAIIMKALKGLVR